MTKIDQRQELAALMGYSKFDSNMDQKDALKNAQAQIYKSVLEKMLASMSTLSSPEAEPNEQQRRAFGALGALLGQQMAQKAPIEDPRIERLMLGITSD